MSAGSRLMREGFVPASPPKGWKRSDMLRPKSANPHVKTFLPYRERLAGQLLSALIDTAHIIGTTEEGAAVVSIEVDKFTLRRLFMFDVDIEDLEAEEDDDSLTDKEDEGVAIDFSVATSGFGREVTIEDGDNEPDYRSPELIPDADDVWKVPPHGKELAASYVVP